MTWFRVDDKFPTHRKVLSLPRGPRRLAAVGAWTLAGAWVSGSSHDGVVPSYVLDDLGIPPKVAVDLVTAGLWEATDDGYLVHDYPDYNPSKEQVDRDRAAAAERQRRGREKQRSRRDSSVTNGVTHTEVTEAVTHPVTVVPSRPVPTPTTPTTAANAADDASAVVAAFVDGATSSGMDRPGPSIIGRVGKSAKQLLSNGATTTDLLVAAKRLGANGWDDLEREVRRVQADKRPSSLRAVPGGAPALTVEQQRGRRL